MSCGDMIYAADDMIKKRFASEAFYADICIKNDVKMGFFNTIPGDGEVAILLYGDVGDGQKVDSAGGW